MSAFGSRPRLDLSVFVLLILALGATSAAAASQEGVVVFEGEFSSSDWSWSTSEYGGLYPVHSDTRSLHEPGQPLLPVKDLTLLIPAGRQVARIWIEPLATRIEKIEGTPTLALPHVTDGGEIHDLRRLESSEGVFPAFWGEFSGTHSWRGYNLLTVNVYPVRSTETADGHSLEYLSEYAVRVVYADGLDERHTVERERLIRGEKESNEDVLRALVNNPGALAGYPRSNGVSVAEDQGPFNPTRTPSLSGSAVQYVILTSEAMEEEFQRLADYKTSLGIPTLVATREFIEANYRNGADIQETMRMFLQDAYSKWGTEYVLLGGDTDVLPPRVVHNTFYPAGSYTEIPVDLYFACLDGTWNGNNNSLYGEANSGSFVGDDADFAEELYIGRAPVSSAEAARVFVDKVITYETTPAGSGWTNRMLYACEVLFPAEYHEGDSITLDGAQFSHQMVEELVEPCTEMEYMRMYETNAENPWDTELTRQALIDTLNTGHYGIFNQIGHGFYFNMSVGDGNFVTTDADALTNGDHLFALFSLNCASAAFDYSCLMERFLQNPNGGSILSIGSARAAFPNNSNNYQQGFFEALLCTPDNRVGKLIALSRLPYLANTFYNYVDRWTYENYSLLGDPTVPIWTDVPEALSVAMGDLNLGPNQKLVSVSDGLGLPVVDAQVCLSRQGEDFAVGRTDFNGQVVLEYLANSPGEVQLKVSGENLAQHVSTVQTLPGEIYFDLNSIVAIDGVLPGAVGNSNTMVEAGESVGLLVSLLETAGSEASSLEGTLSTNTPGVSFSVDTVEFSDVAGGGISMALDPFMVHFASDMVDGTPVDFVLEVVDGSFENYRVEWTTVVKAPEAEVVLLDWEDVTYGNGNGLVDSGERIAVTVSVKNFGAGRCDQLELRLRTVNSNVVLYDTLATITDLDLMETSRASRTFSLALVHASRNSESFLVLTDNYGRVFEHEFYLQRPESPQNIVTDTSLGADIIALSWDPSEDENLYGYDIYRSESPEGPFTRVNTDVVAGTSYFRDEGLGQLTKYYYHVQTMGYSMVPSEASDLVEQSTAPAESSGFPVGFLNETSGHLAVGDVDGDGDYEIILGSDELYVWHHDGTELMDGDLDSQTLGPLTSLNGNLQPGGITLANFDDQPGQEMIFTNREGTPTVHVLNKDGLNLPGWPKTTVAGSGTKWNWATPAVGDIDGDGDPELVINCLNGVTWAWHQDGTEVIDGDDNPATDGVFIIRPGSTSEWGTGSPALCDLDGDGAKDIIFGTGNYDGGPKLVAYKSDGSYVSGFPYPVADFVNNSPAVGDLNNDGVMEIVFYDRAENLYVVREDGTDYPGFPVNMGFGGKPEACPSVAIGDMDQDGELEIIFAGNNNGDSSELAVVDTDIAGGTSGQTLSGWPIEVPGSSEGSPVVGDIDGDSIPDILFGIGGGSEDAPNNLYAFKANGSSIDGFPITLNGPLRPSPVICDLDRDSDVDIVYGGWDRVVHVWDMPFAFDQRNCPWPTYAGNVHRDGVFIPLNLVDVQENNELPAAAFQVDAPYPNPFNPSTSVRLHVPVVNGASSLELVIYDMQGRKVRTLHNGPIASGWHTMVWDGRDNGGRGQSSGMYFMRARSGSHASIHKMTLVK